jgi:hypothetical protein
MRKMIVQVLSGNIPVLGLGSWIDSSPFLISFYETLRAQMKGRGNFSLSIVEMSWGIWCLM